MRAATALVVALAASWPVAGQQVGVEVGTSQQDPTARPSSDLGLRELGTFVNPPILEPSEPAAQETATPRRELRLDLSSLPALAPGEWKLFPDQYLSANAALEPVWTREGKLGLWGDYPSGARPGSAPPAVIALATAIRWDFGEDGGLDMSLFSLKPKQWDDLDTWEKIGWVTSRASAIAGAAILLDSLF